MLNYTRAMLYDEVHDTSVSGCKIYWPDASNSSREPIGGSFFS
jgi:hypothetical protein